MVAVDRGGQPTHDMNVRLRRELYAQSSLVHSTVSKTEQESLIKRLYRDEGD
jgi:hypothetical protein